MDITARAHFHVSFVTEATENQRRSTFGKTTTSTVNGGFYNNKEQTHKILFILLYLVCLCHLCVNLLSVDVFKNFNVLNMVVIILVWCAMLFYTDFTKKNLFLFFKCCNINIVLSKISTILTTISPDGK